jgi:hypothetical protein
MRGNNSVEVEHGFDRNVHHVYSVPTDTNLMCELRSHPCHMPPTLASEVAYSGRQGRRTPWNQHGCTGRRTLRNQHVCTGRRTLRNQHVCTGRRTLRNQHGCTGSRTPRNQHVCTGRRTPQNQHVCTGRRTPRNPHVCTYAVLVDCAHRGFKGLEWA